MEKRNIEWYQRINTQTSVVEIGGTRTPLYEDTQFMLALEDLSMRLWERGLRLRELTVVEERTEDIRIEFFR